MFILSLKMRILQLTLWWSQPQAAIRRNAFKNDFRYSVYPCKGKGKHRMG